jgi:hypothetical protein
MTMTMTMTTGTATRGFAMKITAPLKNVWRFYADGFRAMRLGRTLWKLVIIKLLVMFGVIKLLFFSETLHDSFETDEAREAYVIEKLTQGR